ncbi:MAG: GGDEF domain-containing protein [Clostridia bacterium]|nr:GGDEF domain-containing protein [Clostridia bacterium]
MFNKLFVKDAYYNHEFLHHINKINMRRGYFYARIIFVIELMMLILSFISPNFFRVESLEIYRYHYLSILIYSGIMAIITKLYKEKYIRLYHYVMNITVFFGLFWGASISVLDLEASGTMSVYLTFVFMLSMVILTRPDVSLAQYIIIQLIFILSLKDNGRTVEVVMNSTIFIFFAWTVVRQQFNFTYNQFLKDKLIKEKNQELAERNEDLVRLSTTDHLTGMYNRYSMDNLLNTLWVESYSNQQNFVVFMIDIDYFKKFNDSYGHVIGDACIVAVSDILKSVSKKYNGYGFRYGGDEFCLLFTNQDAALIEAEIHQRTDDMPLYYQNEKVSVSLSIGLVSDIPVKHHQPWHVVDLADQKLYEVKSKRKRRKDD